MNSSFCFRLLVTRMYLRPVHAEHDVTTLQSFIKKNALGILTTALASPNFPLLQSTHIPWVYDINKDKEGEEKEQEDGSDLGMLRGHLARNNPHAKALLEAICDSNTMTLQEEVMVLFNAPHDSYVTPQYYVQTKPRTGKVVPTWNYAAAQIYGIATIYAKDQHFILQQVTDLTDQEESKSGKEKSWKVKDAPEKYIDLLSKAIIGIEIKVTRLEGKYKMSQELEKEDRQGVIDGFESTQTEVGRAIAQIVRERDPS